MTNDALFIDVLAQIEREPSTWFQRQWAMTSDCGTSYCLAGHAVVLSGHQIAWEQAIQPLKKYGLTNPKICGRVVGSDEPLATIACQLLGLEPVEAVRLFHTDNALEDLYRISADLMSCSEDALREKVAAKVADGRVQP